MLKYHRLFLTSLAVCALAISAAPLWADDEDDDRDGQHSWSRDRENGDQDGNSQGEDEDDDGDGDHRHRDHEREHDHHGFRGTINLDHGLVLTATTNAPAGAQGRA